LKPCVKSKELFKLVVSGFKTEKKSHISNRVHQRNRKPPSQQTVQFLSQITIQEKKIIFFTKINTTVFFTSTRNRFPAHQLSAIKKAQKKEEEKFRSDNKNTSMQEKKGVGNFQGIIKR
jgi:hypothetical protein